MVDVVSEYYAGDDRDLPHLSPPAESRWTLHLLRLWHPHPLLYGILLLHYNVEVSYCIHLQLIQLLCDYYTNCVLVGFQI